jgi:hypothetical protein
VGRAPAFWTEENARLIKENFVAVSVSNFDQERNDSVGQFFRDAGMQLPGAGGSQWCVTASGKVLLSNNHNGLGFDVKMALEKWYSLPAAERAAGTIEIGEFVQFGDRDGTNAPRALPTPPPGGLIVKVYYRAFMRDGEKLRYVAAQDLWHDEIGKKSEEEFDRQYPGLITTPQAQPDHMWLTAAEWKSLLPTAPRRGDEFPAPANITDRLIRWHLNPLSVYGETNALDPKTVTAGELTFSVESVSPTSVRLRALGFARLGTDPRADVADGKCASIDQWGYEPRLFGYIEYNPQAKVITRFDLVAFGDHFGRLGICESAARPGLQPLGIAFELVTGETPADRIPPGRTPSVKDYFK